MNTNNESKTAINLEDSNGNFKTGEAYCAEHPDVAPCRHGLLGVADGCILRGDVRRGLALLGRVARKLPKIYHDMADIFDADGVLSDPRMAARYDRLADRREKALRQRARRNRRQRTERHRASGDYSQWSRAA